jgi:hypothetical protein
VRDVAPDPELPDHVVARVDVDAVDPVDKESGEPYPNLLGGTSGQRLDITIRAEAAERAGLAPDRRIVARVQRFSPSRCFADPARLSTQDLGQAGTP